MVAAFLRPFFTSFPAIAARTFAIAGSEQGRFHIGIAPYESTINFYEFKHPVLIFSLRTHAAEVAFIR